MPTQTDDAVTSPSKSNAAPREGRRGRGVRGGRAKRVQRAGPHAAAPAFITRRIPYYELLSEEGLQKLDDTADTILQEIGIEIFGDPVALDLWRNAGADVEGERVRFPRGLVRSVIQASAPGSFVQQARNPARSVTIGGDNVVFVPAYGPPFVSDLEGGRRYGTLEDFRNLIKLAYASPWIHHSGGTICEPVDIPVNKRHLDMVYSHIRYSDKAFLGSITTKERAEDSIELARIAFGRDFTDENCVIMGNVNVNSPLVYDGMVTEVIRTYAAANQGSIISPFILGGAMGPVTSAGAIAQAHAEAMVGVALTQLVRPGAPVIYGNFLSSMSLRSGAPTFGMPEPAVAYLAVGQLARRLGVPLRCGGSLTSSKIADAQATQESADSLMPALLSGSNFILQAAGWLEGGLVMGYEKFVMDADHLGMMHSFLKGLPLDDNALALDAFREVGPGKHFFGCAHTMDNYETAFFDSELSDSTSYEQWRDNGEEDTIKRAHRRWTATLESYEAPALDQAVDEELQAFIRGKKHAVDDAWY